MTIKKQRSRHFLDSEPLYETLKLIGVQRGKRVEIKAGRTTFFGKVIDVLKGYIVIEENPTKVISVIKTEKINYIRIIE